MDLLWGGSLSGVWQPGAAYPVTFLGKLRWVRLFEEAAGERVEVVGSVRYIVQSDKQRKLLGNDESGSGGLHSAGKML